MLGDRLVELRKKKKLTQQQAAKHLGIPRSTYSNYELGKREPDFETLKNIANFFEVNIDWLLGEDMKNKPISKHDPLYEKIEQLSEEDKKYILELIERLTKK
ncbi:MAG TPA: helix-turn-helix transcriptional regulator [Cytophagaceae bacterium]|jgi:transcriptional regulator with XRE-family HTH domain